MDLLESFLWNCEGGIHGKQVSDEVCIAVTNRGKGLLRGRSGSAPKYGEQFNGSSHPVFIDLEEIH